jgi:uncharacterized protein
MTTARLSIPPETLAGFCLRWHVTELALFGSILRDDFRPDSDIDLLVTFAPDTRRTFADLEDMESELSSLLGRKVDLVEREAVEQSRNYIRRRRILATAEPIYAR